MAGGRPSFRARTNSLTMFQSCVLAWSIKPSMLLLVSSRMASWTVGRAGGAGSLARAGPSTTSPQPTASHAETRATRFMAFFPYWLLQEGDWLRVFEVPVPLLKQLLSQAKSPHFE